MAPAPAHLVADDLEITAWDETGSGSDICSALTTQDECPYQCIWCVEARICAAQLQECVDNMPVAQADDSWWPMIELLLVMCVLALAFTRPWQRPSRAPAIGGDAVDGGEYQLGGAAADDGAKPSGTAMELESQTLLQDRDDREGRLLSSDS